MNMKFVSIDELVPDNHLLRLIDKNIDFSFLLEKVRPFYSEDNGRPSDPLILFKMMFIGYLFGIRSERQLEREIKMNIAYRWFSKNKVKVTTRNVWEEHKEKVRLNRLSKSGKMLYKFRKEKIERSFADSKELHGLRYCRLRGLKNAGEEALLIQNI